MGIFFDLDAIERRIEIMLNHFVILGWLYGALGILSALSAWAGDLENAQKLIQKTLKSGHTPVAIFDLDETLIDTQTRKVLGLRDAARELKGDGADGARGAVLSYRLASLYEQSNRYDLEQMLKTAGIATDSPFFKPLIVATMTTYNSGEYIDFDRQVPCAVSFVRKIMRPVRGQGVFPVFLTGRNEANLGAATLQSLKTLGFIRNGDAFLLKLKGDSKEHDAEFKERVALGLLPELKKKGINQAEVVLVAENEPKNLNLLSNVFPKAVRIFIGGAQIGKEPLPAGLAVHRDFCE